VHCQRSRTCSLAAEDGTFPLALVASGIGSPGPKATGARTGPLRVCRVWPCYATAERMLAPQIHTPDDLPHELSSSQAQRAPEGVMIRGAGRLEHCRDDPRWELTKT